MADPLLALTLHDLQLLSLLLRECSVTRVADRSGQAQPAVSRKLQRFRELLGDPLLVRSGAGLVLTERAAALRAPLHEILGQLPRIEAGTPFEPASLDRAFSIACADCLPPTFLPALIARVVAAGPRLSARVRPVDPAFDVGQALDDGSIDLVVSNSPHPREDLRTAPLYSDEVVCMMRAGHPQAPAPGAGGRLTLARYLQLAHLAPHASSLRRSGPIDGELAKTGYERVIRATVPEFNLVPYVLLDSDLVFTTARRFAEHYAQQMPIVVVPAPVELPPMRFYQLWHERNHASAASRWLREQLAGVAAALARAGPADRLAPGDGRPG